MRHNKGWYGENRRHSESRRIMRPYAFLTTDSWRIEVQARNAREAHSKASNVAKRNGKELTRTYTTYGRDGVDTGWRTMQ